MRRTKAQATIRLSSQRRYMWICGVGNLGPGPQYEHRSIYPQLELLLYHYL